LRKSSRGAAADGYRRALEAQLTFRAVKWALEARRLAAAQGQQALAAIIDRDLARI
jgi:hypothetical protein